MGYEFEVHSWEGNVNDGYQYVEKYAGDDKEEAFRVINELKENGAGCVKLEWR